MSYMQDVSGESRTWRSAQEGVDNVTSRDMIRACEKSGRLYLPPYFAQFTSILSVGKKYGKKRVIVTTLEGRLMM